VPADPPPHTGPVLAEHTWRAREHVHRLRAGTWTQPHRDRAAAGRSHPVLDFLFTYYSHRPGRLDRWDPGLGVALAGDADRFLERPGYRRGTARGEPVVLLDPVQAAARHGRTATFVARLLRAVAGRPPLLSCFGLHEWAMVYGDADRRRHGDRPLRLGPQDTDRVVEELTPRCTHHDAFRFFTPAAQPLNRHRPARTDQVAFEQPGCLHVSMDHYKWAYKLAPATGSELLLDCFELAVAARDLDMRAGPYDLTALGYPPVPVETPQGRARYVSEQAALATRADPTRQALIALCEQLLTQSQRTV
jgi:hypothetical protein